MNLIEIHNDDTVNTGYYSIWFKANGQMNKRKCSEAFTNSLLNMRQKEDFFMGKYRFQIMDSDFKELTESDPLKPVKYKHELP
jgi:hypothetical protein